MLRDNGLSDEILIRECKAGSRTAFNKLIERYKKMGFSLAYHLTGSSEDAEDISQEAFIIVYTKITTFKEESAFKTWFYKIIVNLCRRYFRKKKMHALLSLNVLNRDGETVIAEPRSESNPETDISARQTGTAIVAALKKLPRRQREIFAMKHLKEMKITEISAILDCSEGTVKSHLFRAVRNLQKILGGRHEV